MKNIIKAKSCDVCMFYLDCKKPGNINNAYGGLECSKIWKNRTLSPHVRRSAEADKLLQELFNHVGDPHGKIWPQCGVGKIINGEQVWFVGGVDDEFRDYLVRVKKYISRHCA